MVTETHYVLDKDIKLTIEIDNKEPLKLSTFCQSMEGIYSEYSQFILDNKLDVEPCEKHIYVEKITQGCFFVELVSMISSNYSLIEQANSIIEFGSHLKSIFDWATNRGDKPNNLTEKTLKNFNNILEPIALDSKSQLNIQSVNINGNVNIYI